MSRSTPSYGELLLRNNLLEKINRELKETLYALGAATAVVTSVRHPSSALTWASSSGIPFE